jgi:hypothetical protein
MDDADYLEGFELLPPSHDLEALALCEEIIGHAYAYA